MHVRRAIRQQSARRYDRKELSFRQIVDVQFVAAMGPPGGGRNSITNRYARHFSIVSVTAFDADNMTTIFSSLVDWWLKKYSYGASLAKLAPQLVAATLDVYSRCQRELLPTPAKSHYTFNLRDVSKVVQGACCAAVQAVWCAARACAFCASHDDHMATVSHERCPQAMLSAISRW